VAYINIPKEKKILKWINQGGAQSQHTFDFYIRFLVQSWVSCSAESWWLKQFNSNGTTSIPEFFYTQKCELTFISFDFHKAIATSIFTLN
jgi:hypothetical protein